MSDGRTVWWAKDAAWWRRERIVELGQEFGSAGPAVVDWLECEAKAQNDGGLVKTGYRAIAHGAFVDLSTVCPVVSRSVSLGLLDDFEEADRTFTCRISGWKAEQERARESVKKANQRAIPSKEIPANDEVPPDGSVPPRPGLSRSVPKSPPTGQDRTGVNTNQQAKNARARARQELPTDFPHELRRHADVVTQLLVEVAQDHDAKAVHRLEVGRTIAAHPRRPVVKTAHDLASWAVDPPRPVRDVVATYRSFLARERDLAGVERLDEQGRPASPGPVGATNRGGRRGRESASDLLRALDGGGL